jgi:hypothetical protein
MIHRTIHSFLNIKAAVSYVPYQELESIFFLGDLLDTPNDLLHHIRRFTHSLSTQMIYGYRCVNKNDPNLRQLFEVGPCASNSMPVIRKLATNSL